MPARGLLQLVMLEERRGPEPPVGLPAVFYEPGTASQVAAELQALADVVIAIGAPTRGSLPRACDELLRARGVAPAQPDQEILSLVQALERLGSFQGAQGGREGPVPEEAFRQRPVIETNADAVFCSLQGRRLPAKRHPPGMTHRILELLEQKVVDDGGDLWQRRIEEVDAAAAALCAYRYAVGLACWLGDPAEAVIVLPGASIPEEFSKRGVLAPVERLHLPQVG